MIKHIKYATKIVEAWIKGQKMTGKTLSEEMKIIFQAAIDTMIEAENKINRS